MTLVGPCLGCGYASSLAPRDGAGRRRRACTSGARPRAPVRMCSSREGPLGMAQGLAARVVDGAVLRVRRAMEDASKVEPMPEADGGEIACLFTDDGRLLCDESAGLDEGEYEVHSWWAGAAARARGGDPLVCSRERSVGCEVFCTRLPSGELVCEGLVEGRYAIETVTSVQELLDELPGQEEGKQA